MKKIIAKLLAIFITAVLLAVLLSQITLGNIVTTLTSIDPVYIIIGFILYLGTYFFRALRFHILLSNKVNLKDLFAIVCVHNMANNIFPARTGELSYVFLAKKLHKIPVGEGIASLMVVRVLDFITISFLFFLSTIFIRDLPDDVSVIIAIIVGLLVFILLLYLALVLSGEIVVDKIRILANRINALRFSLVQYLLRKGDEAVPSFKLMKSKKLFGKVFVVSLAVWCFQYAMLYILANAMGISLTIWCMLFALTFVFFTSVLPIQTLGGFGIIEGGWALGFMVIGVPKELAISSGFCFHVILYLYFLILGLYGGLTLKSQK